MREHGRRMHRMNGSRGGKVLLASYAHKSRRLRLLLTSLWSGAFSVWRDSGTVIWRRWPCRSQIHYDQRGYERDWNATNRKWKTVHIEPCVWSSGKRLCLRFRNLIEASSSPSPANQRLANLTCGRRSSHSKLLRNSRWNPTVNTSSCKTTCSTCNLTFLPASL